MPGRTVDGMDDSFWINDILLQIAPTQINISYQSFNYEWQTLRTQSSRKTKSGHSVCNIALNVTFVGESAINDTLRPLIAQLRLTPFCFCDNKFLRNAIFPTEKEEQRTTLALAFRSAEIVVEPDTAPITVQAVFNFSYFNYFPYSPFFRYKKEPAVFSDPGVANTTGLPIESNAWKLFYQDELKRYSPIRRKFDGNLKIQFNEFETTTGETEKSLLLQQNILLELDTRSQKANSFLGSFGGIIKGDGWNLNLGTAMEEAARQAEIPGVALNASQGTFAFSEPTFLTPVLERMSPLSGEPRWPDDLIKQAIQSIRSTLSEIQSRGRSEVQLEAAGFVEVPNLSVSRGLDIRTWRRLRELDFLPSEGEITVRLTVSIQNVLSMLPVIGHRYATFQHLGSSDAIVHIDLMARGEQAVRRVNWLYAAAEESIHTNKKIPQGLQAIAISNDFVALLVPGSSDSRLRYFITTDASTDTIPGEPGTFALSLSLIESGLGPTDRLDNEDLRQEYISDHSARNQIARKLCRYFSLGTVSEDLPLERQRLPSRPDKLHHRETFHVQTNLDPIRGAYFIKRLNSLVNPYTSFLQQSRNYFGMGGEKVGEFLAFSRLTDSDVAGIQRIQRILQDERRIDEAKWQRLNISPDTIDALSEGEFYRIRDADRHRSVDAQIQEQQEQLRIRTRFGSLNQGDSLLQTGQNQHELLERNLAKLMEKSPQTILALPFIQDWIRAYETVAQEIIDSGEIGSEDGFFGDVAKQLLKNNWAAGSEAYKDFQLQHVASELNTELKFIDPDFYFWNPSSVTSIDPIMVNNARLTALSNHASMSEHLERWAKGDYLTWLNDDIRQTIVDRNINDVSGKMRTALFPYEVTNETWSNATDQLKTRGRTSASGKKYEPAPIEVPLKVFDPAKGDVVEFKHQRQLYNIIPRLEHSADPNKLLGSGSQYNPDGTLPRPSTGSFFHDKGAWGFLPVDSPLPLSIPLQYMGQTSHAGARRVKKEGIKQHGGVDFAATSGTPVYAIAQGVVSASRYQENAAGWYVGIDHPNGFSSYYMHLNVKPKVSFGVKVNKGQHIGEVGASGNAKGGKPHLHLEVRKTGTLGKDFDPNNVYDPANLFFIQDTYGKHAQQYQYESAVAGSGGTGPGEGVVALEAALAEWEKSLRNGQGNRMIRAYPAFKLYFIEDDSEDRRRFGLDDFFSYNAIKSIRCVRNKNIPADLLELEITNVSGTLMNRKFSYPNISTENPNSVQTADTLKENPLASLAIKEGQNCELRLGYSNDAEKLTTVFVGKVAEVAFSESEDLITLTCQSHGAELVQSVKGAEKPEILDGWFYTDALTETILTDMMAQPELQHFGRWQRSSSINTDTQTFRTLLVNKWRLRPSPQDDNIFAPYSESLDTGLILDDLYYHIFQTTIWDIFQEMTLRHPGWIASPVPYKDKFGPRMTMYFGLPGQLYFARDPTAQESINFHQIGTATEASPFAALHNSLNDFSSPLKKLLRSNSGEQGELARTLLGAGGSDKVIEKLVELSKSGNSLAMSIVEETIASYTNAQQHALARDSAVIKPFRNYHLLTSENHIIWNNITATSIDSHNTVSVQYTKTSFDSDSQQFVPDDDFQVETIKADNALPDEDIKERFTQYDNCYNKQLARRYALALLQQELSSMYKGQIIIIGNPDIKPQDICFLMDSYNDVIGPVVVEQVVHTFSKETGFITEITPNLFCTVNELSTTTMADAVAMTIEGSATARYTNRPETLQSALATYLALGADAALTTLETVAMASVALITEGLVNQFNIGSINIGGAGSFMRRNVVPITNHMQPVFLHPLLHHGKPMLAGLPADKINATWMTTAGKWIKEGKEGWDMIKEDWYDKLTWAPGYGLPFATPLPPQFD